MRVTALGSFFMISLAVLSVNAQDANGAFKGIFCEGNETGSNPKPTLIIRDISAKNATLILNLDGGIPDVRNSTIDRTFINGKEIVGYISQKSSIEPNSENFAAYTDGSTPQDTTRAEISFEDGRRSIRMNCRDGMAN